MGKIEEFMSELYNEYGSVYIDQINSLYTKLCNTPEDKVDEQIALHRQAWFEKHNLTTKSQKYWVKDALTTIMGNWFKDKDHNAVFLISLAMGEMDNIEFLEIGECYLDHFKLEPYKPNTKVISSIRSFFESMENKYNDLYESAHDKYLECKKDEYEDYLKVEEKYAKQSLICYRVHTLIGLVNTYL